jgi:hypothetical protein
VVELSTCAATEAKVSIGDKGGSCRGRFGGKRDGVWSNCLARLLDERDDFALLLLGLICLDSDV